MRENRIPPHSLTRLAELDLRSITRYTMRTWWTEQARQYAQGLLGSFQTTGKQPALGRRCESIHPGLRRFEHGKHVVFYLSQPGGMLIVSVLHQQMLPAKSRFKPDSLLTVPFQLNRTRCPQLAQECRESAPVLRLAGASGGARLELEMGRILGTRLGRDPRGRTAGVASNIGQDLEGRSPRQARDFELSTGKGQYLAGWMRGTQTKYKILWFLVDTYHRQRYFFICGC